MNNHPDPVFDRNELAASLTPLGIREITERMEVSPLLVDQGDLTQDQTATVCCSCKFPRDVLDDGSLPYPTVEGPIGSILR